MMLGLNIATSRRAYHPDRLKALKQMQQDRTFFFKAKCSLCPK